MFSETFAASRFNTRCTLSHYCTCPYWITLLTVDIPTMSFQVTAQLLLCAQLLISSLYLSAVTVQHITTPHRPRPLYWVRVGMSRVISPSPKSPSATLSTVFSMVRTSARVSSLPRLWLLITKSLHLMLSRKLIRLMSLTLWIPTNPVRQEASEARCSVETEARSTFSSLILKTEPSSPWWARLAAVTTSGRRGMESFINFSLIWTARISTLLLIVLFPCLVISDIIIFQLWQICLNLLSSSRSTIIPMSLKIRSGKFFHPDLVFSDILDFLICLFCFVRLDKSIISNQKMFLILIFIRNLTEALTI